MQYIVVNGKKYEVVAPPEPSTSKGYKPDEQKIVRAQTPKEA
jgi:hypothetical protein